MTLPSRPYAAFLFDMDGTLLTSVASAERAWSTWALGHGLDPADVLAVMHGVRAVETVKRFAPAGADIDAETRAITELEIADVADIQEIPGAAAFLASLPADAALRLVDTIGPQAQPHTAVVETDARTAQQLEQAFRISNQLMIEPDRPLSLFD